MIRIAKLFPALVALTLLSVHPSRSHCDTMDGPVVKAAQHAISTGNVNLVLIWVHKKDEQELRAAFEKTLAVRRLNAETKNLADRYFLETVVRLHRVGEGASYTGLKPAGSPIDPVIGAADKALLRESEEELYSTLTKTVKEGLIDHFKRVVTKRKYAENDIDAGREYVGAYVEFIHYVERLYVAADRPAKGHFEEPVTSSTHGDEGR